MTSISNTKLDNTLISPEFASLTDLNSKIDETNRNDNINDQVYNSPTIHTNIKAFVF